MNRKDFIKATAITTLIGASMKLKALNSLLNGGEDTAQMPVLFVGHGNPMNAIEDNRFSREMKKVAQTLPNPKAILMVSAHWETKGTHLTIGEHPPTIHDFGGFPKALFDAEYPAPGSQWLAEETQKEVKKTKLELDATWGFDHGNWSVTKNMYPHADVPIVQLSLDYTQAPQYHYDLAKELATLRKKGVLIIGSGNMVHNLRMVALKGSDFNASFGHDWAIEANETFKRFILSGNHQALIDYGSLGKAVALSIPTPEHYLPLLYSLALKQENESISLFNDDVIAGAASMTSLVIGGGV